MSAATITVRVPRDLAERMRRHREVNWSEVVRRAIEEFLERLEEAEMGEEPGASVAAALLEMGIDPSQLEPLPRGEEERLARRLGEEKWRRVRSLRAIEEA